MDVGISGGSLPEYRSNNSIQHKKVKNQNLCVLQMIKPKNHYLLYVVSASATKATCSILTTIAIDVHSLNHRAPKQSIL